MMTSGWREPMSAARQRPYLRRLGFDEPPETTPQSLRRLHRAHLETIPFENLDIHLGRAIQLELSPILEKLIDHERGGYCYELNGAFGAFLDSLGFHVTLFEARVYDGEQLGRPFDHACLRVDLDAPHLVDVGFGASFLEPLLFEAGVVQKDPAGTYRLEERSDGVDLIENGTRQYRVSLEPRSLADFTAANEFQQTSASSHFTHNTVCSVATHNGRVTIRGRRLIETVDGQRTERELEVIELAETLRGRFGIHLPLEQVRRLAEDRPV